MARIGVEPLGGRRLQRRLRGSDGAGHAASIQPQMLSLLPQAIRLREKFELLQTVRRRVELRCGIAQGANGVARNRRPALSGTGRSRGNAEALLSQRRKLVDLRPSKRVLQLLDPSRQFAL